MDSGQGFGREDMKVRRVLDILIVSVYFLSVVSGLSLTGTTISPTSALRSTEEIRDVANEQQEGRVRLTAAGSLSAEIQTSAIRAVAKLLATCGLGVWSAKKVHLVRIQVT